VGPENVPIEILSVEVSSISFPPEYNQRINDRMGAEVEVARLQQEVQQAEQRHRASQPTGYGLTTTSDPTWASAG